jgi:hypothetical protein
MESPANPSQGEFPANREKYREIYEFGPQIPLASLPIFLILGEFRSSQLEMGAKRNRELSPTYQGIDFP